MTTDGDERQQPRDEGGTSRRSLEMGAALAVVGAFAALCVAALWVPGEGAQPEPGPPGARPSVGPRAAAGSIPTAAEPTVEQAQATSAPEGVLGPATTAEGAGASPPNGQAARWVEEPPPPSLERPLEAVRGELRLCLDDVAQRVDGPLTLTLAFRPLPDGSFDEIAIIANSAQDPYLEACAADVLEELRFEPSGREDFQPASYTLTRVPWTAPDAGDGTAPGG